jgi:signal transduction histidine kinase/ligand-binding sensor domain-containing protein/CheY-like chemotaxis protein
MVALNKLSYIKSSKTFGLIGLLIMILHSLAAQEKQYLFKNIDKSNGLSHNHVTYFLRDSKGFVWIGTVEGLCRFDGYSFKVYKNDPADTTSLKANMITRLFEDHQGNIWIAAGDYFDIYNPETEIFTHQQSLFNNRIQVPVGSKWFHTYDQNRNILYANSENGVYKYIVSLDSVVQIGFPYKDTTKIISNMDIDKRGNIWIVCTNSYLYKLNGTSFDITDSVKLPVQYNNSYRFYIDKDNDIWLYDNNNASGAIFYNTKSATLRYLSAQSIKGRLSSNDLRSLTQDENGMIWIGTDHGGINIVNKTDFSVQMVTHDPSNKRSLCDNSITRLYKDYQGFIWVGSFKRGMSYYHQSQYLFDQHKVILENSKVSGYNDIDNFAEDARGNIWIGTNGGGLLYYDRSNNTFKQFINNPSDPSSISANVIIGLTIDQKERLWVGTYFGGLNLFDGRKFQHFRNNPADRASLSDDRIWDICEDSDGKLWIATLLGGVNVFDPEKKKVIESFRLVEDTTIRSNSVFSVIEGTHNTMWFATAGGIRSFNRNTRKFQYYYRRENDPESLSSNFVYDVYEDSRGFIWAATSDGLNKLDPSTGKFRVFKQENGLPGNFILTLEEDQNHNLWMSTSNGLSNLIITKDSKGDTFSYTFRNYDEFDGLQGNEFNEKAILKTRKGEMFFGGPNGFNVIDPSSMQSQNIKAAIVFTDFQIFNKSISNKKPFNNHYLLKKSITYADEIRLKHDENVFTIEFSNLNFIHPERRKYMYRLDNFKDEWFMSESKERKVTYTNLDPGKYIFRVRSTNNNGSWNDQEAQLAIIILPPWWETLFIKIFSIVFITSVVVGFYYYRIFQLNQQKRLLEMKVNVRTNDLSDANFKLYKRQKEILVQNMELEKHRNNLEQLVQERTNELEIALKKVKESDRLKSAFLANMSHEIRTPMNAIIGFSSLLDNPDITNKERDDFINQIHTNSESLLMLINDLLDLSLIEANQMIMHKEPFQLNDLVDQLFSNFKLNNKNSNVEIKLNHKLKADNLVLHTDQYRLKQILSNFMNNACKFTETGIIELVVTKEKNRLTIAVKDTGPGIAANDIIHLFKHFRKLGEEISRPKRGAGLGLAISKRLADLLGGTIEVNSQLGKGSVFTFIIPFSRVVSKKEIRMAKSKPISNMEWANKSILIVEDEENNYLYLKNILERTHATITWAENGQEALDFFESGNSYDIVLMDIKMPEMNGMEVLNRLKEKNPKQLIIAQTAYARTEDEIMFRMEGFDDYIAKPINANDLIQILEKYL